MVCLLKSNLRCLLKAATKSILVNQTSAIHNSCSSNSGLRNIGAYSNDFIVIPRSSFRPAFLRIYWNILNILNHQYLQDQYNQEDYSKNNHSYEYPGHNKS